MDGWSDGPTDGRTDQRTDRRPRGPTDRPSFRDARTHLKRKIQDPYESGLGGRSSFDLLISDSNLRLKVTLFSSSQFLGSRP